MKKSALVFVLALFVALPLFAKPKNKTYNNTPQEVFDAALRTARERHVITYVDEKNLMITFQTGTSMMSYGFVANASVQPEENNKATLIINVQHKEGKNAGFSFNAGDRMADKFYKQVEEELARKSQQKIAGKTEASHVDVPPPVTANKPEAATTPEASSAPAVSPTVAANIPQADGKAEAVPAAAATPPVAIEKSQGPGKVSVDSTPQGAELTVDGAFVGNAPSILKLLPGKHTIGVSQAGYKTSSQELMVGAGSELTLNTHLIKE